MRRSSTCATFVLSVGTSGLRCHLCWVTRLQHLAATLFVAQVPVTVEAIHKVPVHVGCVHKSSGVARVEGSCLAASQLCGPDVIGQSQGQCCCGTRGGPRGPRVGAVMSLEVEPTFLARVSDATWQHADMEMQKLAQRARGSHALFHVRQVQGVKLVFRGAG